MRKVFLFLLFGMFLFSLASVSAAEWDNIGNYDSETETMLIRNAMGLPNWLGGSTLAEVKLLWGDTKVGVGKDIHVGTFSIISYSNVTDDIFNQLDLTNLKNGQVMARGKQYKVKTYVEEDEMINSCDETTLTNGTILYSNCELVESGNKIIVEEWTPISNPNFNFSKGILYEIGVFVDTEEGDKGDWIPKLMGVEIPQWSSWSASLETNILAWYNLDSDATDYFETYDGSITGATSLPTGGLIDGAYSFDGSNDYMSTGTMPDYTTANVNSVSLWFKTSDNTQQSVALLGASNNAYTRLRQIDLRNDPAVRVQRSDGGVTNLQYGINYGDNNWHHVVYTELDSGGAKLYVDGYLRATDGTSKAFSGINSEFFIGARNTEGTAEAFSDADIDLVGAWGRALTDDSCTLNTLCGGEIEQLYNGGSGISPSSSDQAPVITNPLPANNTLYTSTTMVNFNWTATDDINLVSTGIYVDGVLEYNNTNPTNNSLQTFSKSLSTGIHNWTVIAFDNSSQSTNYTAFVNISIDTPDVTLQAPENNYFKSGNSAMDYIAYVEDKHGVKNVTLTRYMPSGTYRNFDTSGANATNYTFSTFNNEEGTFTWVVSSYNINNFTSDSETRTITFDFTDPVIEANVTTPIIYNFGDNVSTVFNATDTNLNTCWYNYNNTNNTFSCTSGVEQELNITSVPGYTDITFYVNDSAGRSSSKLVNFTYDTSAPTVIITSPNGFLGRGVAGDNETLNFTATDSFNLDTCWYEYAGVNKTVSCTSGVAVTDIFTLTSQQNITVYANDTLGNIGSTTSSWLYYLFENGQTYNENTVETAKETFITDITVNSSLFSLVTGTFHYNGDSYTGTRSATTDRFNFSTTVDIPKVTTQTNYSTYWEIGLVNSTGTTYVNLTGANQTVDNLNMSLCGSPHNIPFINFTVYDEETGLALNADFRSTFVFRPLVSSGTTQISYSDTTTSTNEFDFCMIQPEFEYYLDTNIEVSADNYATRFFTWQDLIVSNDTVEKNLYLLNETSSTSFIVQVIDAGNNKKVGVQVEVERFATGLGVWVTEEVLTTNFEGKTLSHLAAEDVDYRFTVSENGEEIYVSSSTKIFCESLPCTVNLVVPGNIPTGLEELEDLTSSIAYNENTNVFTFTYEDGASTFTSGAINVYKFNPGNSSDNAVVCSQTSVSATAIITCDISSEVNGTYKAVGTVIRSDSGINVVEILYGLKGDTIYNQVGEDGVLWAFFLFMGIIMIGVYRPSLAILASVFGVIAISALNIISIGITAIISVIALALVLLIQVRKE